MPEQSLKGIYETIGIHETNPAPNDVYLVTKQKLSGIQRKEQLFMTHNQEKIQSIETDPEMTREDEISRQGH